MPQLVPGDESHGLRNSVQRYVLLVLDPLPLYLHGEVLVVRVAAALGAVVGE